MHRLFVILLTLVFLGALSLFIKRTKPSTEPNEETDLALSSIPFPKKENISLPAPTGLPISIPPLELRTYASPQSSIQNDLSLLYDYLTSFLLPKKHGNSEYTTQGKDLTEFLRDQNPHRHASLIDNPSTPRLIGLNRKLIDRWGSPLIIHPSHHLHFEIRSIGPDQIPYTEDDTVWPPPSKSSYTKPDPSSEEGIQASPKQQPSSRPHYDSKDPPQLEPDPAVHPKQ